MKKVLVMLLVAATLTLCACGGQSATQSPMETTAPASIDYSASETDISHLESLYAGRAVYHGDLHVHTQSGRESDGKVDINEWPAAMQEAGVDFAAVMDHRQTDHMRLEVWDDTIFIGGSETGYHVISVDPKQKMQRMDTNFLFADLESFEMLLNAFPTTFLYANGLYVSNNNKVPMTRELYAEIIQKALDLGGFFVFPHPQLPDYSPTSKELMDFWFVDYTGFEVMHGYSDAHFDANKKAYALWKDLLAAGKKIYATAGSDTHSNIKKTGLTTIYSTEQSAAAFLSYVRAGDFSPGAMGVRFAIGDTLMGGETAFAGKRLVFSVGDFHANALENGNQFKAVLMSDTGAVFSQEFTSDQTVYFATDVQAEAKYYWVEIHNVTTGEMVGLANPIWNTAN